MINSVHKDSGIFKKLYFYTKERFPVGVTLVTALIVVFNAMYSVVQFTPLTEVIFLRLPFISTTLILFCIFFQVRLLDEFKDYEKDKIAYPDRLLSRGIITKSHLKWLLFALVSLQIALLLVSPVSNYIMWTIVQLYVVLMYLNFFADEFLSSNISLYLFTHQLVIPLFILFSIFGNINVFSFQLDTIGFFISLVILSLPSLLFEIGRKTWSPDREKEGADSYTKDWGIAKTVWILIISQVLTVILLAYLTNISFFKTYTGVIYVLFSVLYVTALFQFKKNPTFKRSKVIEGTSALNMLMLHGLYSLFNFYNI